jgi:hypothetical protein
MNHFKLLNESLTLTLIFSILFVIYEKVENSGYKLYNNIITIILFLIWIIFSKVGTYYIHLYNSQIM